MSNGELIFRNTLGIIKRGEGIAQGLLYCGKKYSTDGGCPCLQCDGHCGPGDGCPCPDCYYTLSYILYSTGEMVCPFCKSMLLRKNIFNLRLLRGLPDNSSINCNLCKNSYDQVYLPMMHCRKCNYNMCPNCAFSKIRLGNFKVMTGLINWGYSGGEGILYCNNRYTNQNMCLCGSCDGTCGYNGCPCPLCDTILGYNIYHFNMTCQNCPGTLLIKTTLGQLQKYESGYLEGFTCDNCLREFSEKQIYVPILHCFECGSDICQYCTFNVIKFKQIVYPYLPQGINNNMQNFNYNVSINTNNNFNNIYNRNININITNDNININNNVYNNNNYNNTNNIYNNNNYNNMNNIHYNNNGNNVNNNISINNLNYTNNNNNNNNNNNKYNNNNNNNNNNNKYNNNNNNNKNNNNNNNNNNNSNNKNNNNNNNKYNNNNNNKNNNNNNNNNNNYNNNKNNNYINNKNNNNDNNKKYTNNINNSSNKKYTNNDNNDSNKKYTNNGNNNNKNENNNLEFSIFANNPYKDNDSKALRNNNNNEEDKKDKKKEKELNDKDEDEDDSKKCVICLEEDKCILLMPCKHVCCCEGCSNDVNKCPICRNKIESKIKIFL